MIRQLEKDLGEHLELVTEGADVELDKTIIESLADPVTHIIRNMADHGTEGVRMLKRGACCCLIQDEDSSIVWGMPCSVYEAGLADEIVSLPQLAVRIAQLAL